LAVLDSLSYYDLFRAVPSATHDELRAAFHAFADTFHPDGHRWRPLHEQEAISRIYCRGAEAWRILSDPLLRARYDEALKRGNLRPENLTVEVVERPRSLAPPSSSRLIDKVRAPGARLFVVRAEELLRNGDPKQAKIQLVMALHLDRGNAALEAFGQQLDAAIAARPDDDKKPRSR
jgi:curved DNA-binding protein CbpA